MTDSSLAPEQTTTAGGPQLATWLADEADPALLLDLLHDVIDPELGVNIVDLGLVYDLQVVDRNAKITMTLTTPACPLGPYMEDSIHGCLWGSPGVDGIDVNIIWDPPWGPDKMTPFAKQALGWPG